MSKLSVMVNECFGGFFCVVFVLIDTDVHAKPFVVVYQITQLKKEITLYGLL